VLQDYDGDNLLLEQARREVLETQLEFSRLAACLKRLAAMEIRYTEAGQLTPLAFPLWAARIQTQVSSESWQARVERMAARLEQAAEATC
jgi:ATP-dependent Lhr-like helicase